MFFFPVTTPLVSHWGVPSRTAKTVNLQIQALGLCVWREEPWLAASPDTWAMTVSTTGVFFEGVGKGTKRVPTRTFPKRETIFVKKLYLTYSDANPSFTSVNAQLPWTVDLKDGLCVLDGIPEGMGGPLIHIRDQHHGVSSPTSVIRWTWDLSTAQWSFLNAGYITPSNCRPLV